MRLLVAALRDGRLERPAAQRLKGPHALLRPRLLATLHDGHLKRPAAQRVDGLHALRGRTATRETPVRMRCRAALLACL